MRAREQRGHHLVEVEVGVAFRVRLTSGSEFGLGSREGLVQGWRSGLRSAVGFGPARFSPPADQAA